MLKCSERMVPLNRVKLTMSARYTAPLGKFPQENLNFVQEKGRRIRLMNEHSTPVKDARPGIKRRLGHA